MKLEFSQQILEKKSQISSLIKIRPVGAEFFHTDGQTDVTKLRVAFRNFPNANTNWNLNSAFKPMKLTSISQQYMLLCQIWHDNN